MISLLDRRLVPDELWTAFEPLLPEVRVRPQGGGRARVDDRLVLAAIVFIVTSGLGWRQLPRCFGVSVPTVHRRFRQLTGHGV